MIYDHASRIRDAALRILYPGSPILHLGSWILEPIPLVRDPKYRVLQLQLLETFKSSNSEVMPMLLLSVLLVSAFAGALTSCAS